MISVVSQALLPRRKQVMMILLSLPPQASPVPSLVGGLKQEEKLAAVIAFENGVDVSYFGNWYSACQISTGSRVPVQELKDESNPARVFSAIDDAAGKRFTLDACCDLVHGVATAWALEARSKGSKDWENISVVLHSSYPEAMSAIQESGATVLFVPCVGEDDAVSTSASGALETPKRTPKAEGGGASAGKVAAALAPPAAVARVRALLPSVHLQSHHQNSSTWTVLTSRC